MYKLLFKLTLIFALACCFLACEKDPFPEKNPIPVEQDKGFEESDGIGLDPVDHKFVVLEDVNERKIPYSFEDEKDDKECNAPSCLKLVEKVKAYYQPIANATCKAFTIGLDCCRKDGTPAFLVLKIKPQKLCKFTDPVEITVKD